MPFLINVAFKIKAPCSWLVAEWTAGDALSLFAAISAALLAIYGISITIRHSTLESVENLRNQVRPFIVIDFLKSKPKIKKWLSESITEIEVEPENDQYEEYSLKSFYFVFSERSHSNDYIEIKRRLKPEQIAVIKNGGIISSPVAEGVIATRNIPYLYLKLILENVGNGAAVQTSVGINSVSTKEKLYAEPVPLKIGDTIEIGLYAEEVHQDSPFLGAYELEITYYDILGNRYKQNHELTISYDQEFEKPKGTISVTQRQELIEGRANLDM